MLAEASRYYKENPKGVEIMCKAMEEMREESYQRGVEAGGEQKVLESIKNIMKNLKLTVHQAMDALGIPADDQPKYLAKLWDSSIVNQILSVCSLLQEPVCFNEFNEIWWRRIPVCNNPHKERYLRVFWFSKYLSKGNTLENFIWKMDCRGSWFLAC